MKKKVLGITIIILLAAVFFVGMWLGKDFDAQGYVEAVLDHHFKGEVDELSEFVKKKSKEELKQQYEESVTTFAENNIINGIELEDELKQQYIDLCKKIFKSMKYDVKANEKINRKEYKVTVEYQDSDVFLKFMDAIVLESDRIMDKVDKGEYKGTLEEINAQMEKEFLENCYNLLEQAYQEAEYGEKMTEIFTIKKNEEGIFQIDDVQMNEFVKKIMGFDTNQD